MAEKKIKVRIKPLHNIGGIGNAGDEVWLVEADAHYWVKEGYVEIVKDPEPGLDTASPTRPADDVVSDHAILKPQSKRSGTRKK